MDVKSVTGVIVLIKRILSLAAFSCCSKMTSMSSAFVPAALTAKQLTPNTAKAVENKENAVSGNKVDIFHEKAENFEIPPQTDRFYFFNPFSIEIFQKVISMIRCSWYEAPREILLFFYYPFDDYRRALASNDGLELLEMIDCRDLEGDNEKEQIMICRMI